MSIDQFGRRRGQALALAAIGIIPVMASEWGNIASAQTTPIGVIGKDDRATPSYNWMKRQRRKAIGQLEIQQADGQYYTCTFTVVGRNIGLTNTHCLLDDQGRKPLKIKAYSMRHGDRYSTSANVDMYWTGLDRSPQTLGEYSRDWAVVRFDRPMGKKTGSFGNTNWSADLKQSGQTVLGKKLYSIGYSGDWPTAAMAQVGNVRGFTPSAHIGCEMLGAEDGLVVHNCDGTPGSSGTGIHSRSRKIQALNVAAVFDPRTNVSLFNLAVPLERFMPAVEMLRKTGGDGQTVAPRP
jgi:V8-like Glu-specific endopeptidase